MAVVPAMWRSASCEVVFLPLPSQFNHVPFAQDFALMNTAPPDDVERSRMVKAGLRKLTTALRLESQKLTGCAMMLCQVIQGTWVNVDCPAERRRR